MKYATALLITAALSLGTASAQSGNKDASLASSLITIDTGRYQGPLSSLLGAMAKTAGYELVLEVNVDSLEKESGSVPVAYTLKNKPFNEVWPLLMDVYGLNYSIVKLGNQEVIRVNKASIQQVVELKRADTSYIIERVGLFYGSPKTVPATEDKPAITTYELDSKTLKVVADPMANSVIVRGTNKEVAEVSAFIRNLDKSAENRFTLDSKKQVTKVDDKSEIYTVKGDAGKLVPFLKAQYPELRFNAVPTGRSIIIEGNPKMVSDALSLLGKVDIPTIGEATTQEVFQLINANAIEVAATLTNTLAQGSADNQNKKEGSSPDATKVGDAGVSGAKIIPDVRSNTLIVRGTPTQVAQIAALIPTLDRKVEQINLQVRIQEITKTAKNSLGVKWDIAGKGSNNSLIKTGNIAIDSAMGLALKLALDPTKSAFNFGVNNIMPVLGALEKQSLAKTVYDGNVTLQSGQLSRKEEKGVKDLEVPSAQVSSGGQFIVNIPSGDTVKTEVVNYGVVINFFDPIVSPDGTITVRLHSKTSDLTNRADLNAAVREGKTPSFIDLLNNETETKISFKPGQTVLLSGITKNIENTSNSGVPYLSQIPLVGALFGGQDTTKEESELMFVITGNIE